MGVLVVVPDLASSSAFSLPQCPEWAAIHLSSSVLLAPRRLRALRQLMTVLLLVLSAVRAWIEIQYFVVDHYAIDYSVKQCKIN